MTMAPGGAAFDWDEPCTQNDRQKGRFHANARSRLRRLADELGLEPGSYEIRSNKGGPAVSGEVVLHHEAVYVQASQPSSGPQGGLLVRSCEGIGDFVGGRNNLWPLKLLDDPSRLADLVRRVEPDLDRRRAPAMGR